MAILDEVLQTLEIQPTGIPTVVRLSQNENGRQIRLTLRGQESSFPAGCLVTISGTKPDGVVYSASGSLDGNVAVINEDMQMTAVAGMWKARVNVTYGGSTIATELIVFEVYADPVDPGSVPSESELNGLVAEAQYWAENARSSAYGSPLVAETAAEMIETDRVYVYTGSESGYTAGHWYYYNGTAWADGGIYNAAAVQTDTTLSVPGMAADSKATGDAITAENTRATTAEGAIAADVAEAAGDIEDIQTDLTGVHGDLDDINAALLTKADQDGTYDNLTAGTALAVLSDSYTEDAVPYKFRRTPYKSRRLMDEIVGGSVAWNQLMLPFDSAYYNTSTTDTVSYTFSDTQVDVAVTATTAIASLYTKTSRQIVLPANHVVLTTIDAKCDRTLANDYFISPSAGSVGSTVRYGALFGTSSPVGVWFSNAYLIKRDSAISDFGIRLAAISSAQLAQGDSFSLRNLQSFDLTQMFGSTIADYIYNLEQSTAGAGVAFFRNLFPNAYYAYNAGELVSISGLSARKAVGKNLLDPSLAYVDGKYINADGMIGTLAAYQYCESYIPVFPDTAYVFSGDIAVNGVYNAVAFYDSNKTFIERFMPPATNRPARFTTPANCAYIRFNASRASFVDFATAEIQLEFGSTATAYEPYESHTYPLDASLTLRGIPKLDSNNNLYYDGDTYVSDGTVTRRYGTRAYASGDESLTDAITDGTTTVYKLTTPTTEAAQPYHEIQICNPDGTEEYVSTGIVPVGHESKYYRDLDAVIPAAPTADGVYTLKCTVTDGVPSYSWEV